MFSGIGGISYALRDFVKPILYCDIDAHARDVLKNNFPNIPIVEDIRNTDKIKSIIGESIIDLVISSSSCVGFSYAGAKQGIQNPETAMIIDTLDLIADINPNMIFMENVPGITKLNNGMDLDFLIDRLDDLGYHFKWEIHSACDAGAWHIRKRWFCLCIKRGYQLKPIPDSSMERYSSWNTETVLQKSKPGTFLDRRRLRMLGNSVVPDCVRTAFFSLYSKYANIVFSPFSTGFVANTKISITINPFKPGVIPTTVKRTRSSKMIEGEKSLRFYPTPRSKNITSSSILTHRCSRDLGTVVRFEPGVVWEKNYIVNPEFVELLMGYPIKFTEI